jgi:O-antigen/teichoic acid export membrane protein
MVVSQALWFVTRLFIIGTVSKEELGIYSLAVSIVGIISLMASVGLWEGSTRYISIFLGQDRKSDVDAVQRASLRIGAIAGIAACAGILIFADVLARYVFYKPELAKPLMVMSLFIPAFVMALILSSIFRGYGIMSPRVYFMDVAQPFIFLVLLCLIAFFGPSLLGIVYAYVASMMAVFALIAGYGYRKIGITPFPAGGGGRYVGEILKFSIPLLSMDFMYLILRSADTLMLGRYVTAEEVGVYSVSITLVAFLSFPLAALDTVYMPIAGELYAKKQMSELARTYKVLTKWIFSLTLPIFFILFFFPEMTITFLFGERFGESALPLRILSLGYLVTAFMGNNIVLLLVMGLSKAAMKVCVAGALLDVLLNYTLIKHFDLGFIGASLSTMISLSAVSLGYSFVLYRHSRMHPISSGYLKPAVASAVIGLIIYAAAKSLPLHFWMLPVYFLLYICGYIASLVFTRSIDKEDVFLFTGILERLGVSVGPVIRVIGRLNNVKIEGAKK